MVVTPVFCRPPPPVSDELSSTSTLFSSRNERFKIAPPAVPVAVPRSVRFSSSTRCALPAISNTRAEIPPPVSRKSMIEPGCPWIKISDVALVIFRSPVVASSAPAAAMPSVNVVAAGKLMMTSSSVAELAWITASRREVWPLPLMTSATSSTLMTSVVSSVRPSTTSIRRPN